MTRTKKKEEKLDFEKVLGECHDGEDLKLLMKDGSTKIVSKEKFNASAEKE